MDTRKYGGKPWDNDHTDSFCWTRMIGSNLRVRSFRQSIPFVNNYYSVLFSHFYRSTPSPPSTFVLSVVTCNMMRKPAISRAYRVAWRCTMMTMNCNRGCISFYSHMIYRKGRLVTFGVYILWWQNIREVSLQGSNKNAVICRTQWSESRIFHCHITVIFSCCSVVVVCTPMTRT